MSTSAPSKRLAASTPSKRLAALLAGLTMVLTLFAGASAANAAHVGGGGWANNSSGKAACEAWRAATVASLTLQGRTVTSSYCFQDQGWYGSVHYN